MSNLLVRFLLAKIGYEFIELHKFFNSSSQLQTTTLKTGP